MNYSVISADNHIIEPRHLFVSRMPQAYRERAPRVMRGAELTQGLDPKLKQAVLAGNASRVFGLA